MITRSEEKENVAMELKEFFPDENITGLVVRRRKSSIVSIDVEDSGWLDNMSTRKRSGSSIEGSHDDLEKIDDIISQGFRKRAFTESSFFLRSN